MRGIRGARLGHDHGLESILTLCAQHSRQWGRLQASDFLVDETTLKALCCVLASRLLPIGTSRPGTSKSSDTDLAEVRALSLPGTCYQK